MYSLHHLAEAQAAQKSLSLIDDCDVVAAHVLLFSPRPGTPAARMSQAERELVRVRAARLRDRAAARRGVWLGSLVGTVQSVLIENKERGHTDCFAPITIAGSIRGDARVAGVAGCVDGPLIGEFE